MLPPPPKKENDKNNKDDDAKRKDGKKDDKAGDKKSTKDGEEETATTTTTTNNNDGKAGGITPKNSSKPSPTITVPLPTGEKVAERINTPGSAGGKPGSPRPTLDSINNVAGSAAGTSRLPLSSPVNAVGDNSADETITGSHATSHGSTKTDATSEAEGTQIQETSESTPTP